MTVALAAAGTLIALLAVLAAAMAAGIVINVVTRVPYAACPPAQIERIFDHLNLPPGTRFYDLGCGDGRVVFAAAARGARATGFELQPLTYLRAKLTQLLRYQNADIRWGDFRHANLRDADCVFCFLVGAVMPQVGAWLHRQLKPGTTVVSYGFAIPNWQASSVLTPDHAGGSATYVYAA